MRDKRFPYYPDDADYTTNAPSYYEDLARKEKLIRLLAERIWGYEKILDETLEQIQERFRAWDKNLEDFPEDVKVLLQKWLDDGTLDHIINETIFNWKLDTSIFEQFRDSVTAQLQQTKQQIRGIPFHVPESNGVDDTSIIQNIFDTQKEIFFPNGVYYVNASTRLKIPSNRKITLSKFAKIKALPTEDSSYRILDIKDVENIEITGGTIEGERNEHLGLEGESGHGISLRGATNIKIKDLTIKDCWGDGIYIGGQVKTFCENVEIENLIISNCRRQGISILSAKDLFINETLIKDINGTLPATGIDIEPNYAYDTLKNINISNLVTQNCENQGIVIAIGALNETSQPIDIKINNHVDYGSLIGFAVNPNRGGFGGVIEVNNGRYYNNRLNGVAIQDHDSTSGKIVVNKPYVFNCNVSQNVSEIYSSGIMILKEEKHNRSTIFGNIDIIEPTVIDNRIIKLMQYSIYVRDRDDTRVNNSRNICIYDPIKLDGIPIYYKSNGNVTDKNKILKLAVNSNYTIVDGNLNLIHSSLNFTTQKTITLPTSYLIDDYPALTFIVESTVYLIIQLPSDHSIVPLTSNGGKIRSATKGSRITLKKSSPTEWYVEEMVGTWEVVPV